MEKNETLYKKIEGYQYGLFRHLTTTMIALGLAGTLAGYVTGNKETVDIGYFILAAGGIGKGGAFISEKRFKPVYGPEDEIQKLEKELKRKEQELKERFPD